MDFVQLVEVNPVMKRLLTMLIVVVSVASLASMAKAFTVLDVPAQSANCRVFPATGMTVCGKFLAFWEKNGGLPVFGLPIRNEFIERSDLDGKEYRVQYFERAVFEMHPENKPPYDVQLAHVGTFHYQSKYPAGIEGSILMYPNAKNVVIEPLDEEGGRIQITTFQTSDRPESVLAFYKTTLQSKGWRVIAERSDFLHLGYSTRSDSSACPENPFCPGGTSYDLSVTITDVSQSLVNVEIFFKITSPR
jgi:hypothetical protein